MAVARVLVCNVYFYAVYYRILTAVHWLFELSLRYVYVKIIELWMLILIENKWRKISETMCRYSVAG